MEVKECLNCGTKFKQKRDNQNYCNKIKTVKCEYCKKEFSYKCQKASGNKKYCCRKCYTADLNTPRKQCVICGRPSVDKYCKEIFQKTCPTCGKSFDYTHKNNDKIFCSVVCANKNAELLEKKLKTQLDKNGGKLAFNTERQKETMIKRYGHSSPAKNKIIKEKIRQTQYERNGGKFAFNTNKQKETMLQKYGGYGRLSSKEELEKQFEIMMERYGVKTPCENADFLDKALKTIIKNNGYLFGNGSTISKTNRKFAELIQERFEVEVILEKYFGGKFFDIFLPESNVYLDLNPTVTHNSTVAFSCLRNGCINNECNHKPISKNYHYERALFAKENGLKLIQVFEWENEDKILNMISHKIKKANNVISAHSCKVEKISSKEANLFLDEFHIQGSGRGQSYCYGLFYDNILVSVATFGKSRFKSKYEYEFIRYAVRRDFMIHGASSKLFKHFINEVSPDSVVSYIDFNHTTTPTFLTSLGFVEESPTGPREVWTKKGTSECIPVTSLLMRGADAILGTNYGSREQSGLNNKDIMLKENYVQVYTAGNRVFSWTNENLV